MTQDTPNGSTAVPQTNKSRLQTAGIILLLALLPFIVFWAVWAPNPEDRIVFIGDILVGAYPTRVYVHQLLTSGQIPLWNPYQLGGMPLLGDIQAAVFYLPNLLLDLFYWNTDIPYEGFERLVVAHYALAGLFMYSYLRSLKLSKSAALLGAIAFQFNGFFIGHRGHYSMFSVVIWVPAILWSLDQIRQSAQRPKMFAWVLAGGFFLSQMIMGGHPQLSFYSGIFILSYSLFQLWPDIKEGAVTLFNRSRPFWQNNAFIRLTTFGITAFIGIGLSAIAWIPMWELLGRSLRSEPTFAFASQFPLLPRNLITLFVPEFLDWSGTEFRIYAGILTLVLTVVAWILPDWKRRELIFFTAVLIIATIMSLGNFTAIHSFLYRFIPGFSSVRVAARIFYFANFSLVVLAALGFETLLTQLTQANKDRLHRFVLVNRWPFAFTCIALLLGYSLLTTNYRPVTDQFYFYDSLFGAFTNAPETADNYLLFTRIINGVWLFLLFWGSSLLLIWLRTIDRISSPTLAFVAVALITLDITTFAPRHDVAPSPSFDTIGMDGFDIYTLTWWQANERDQIITELQDIPPQNRIDNSLDVLPTNYSQIWRLNFSSGYNILDLQERFEIFSQWPYLDPSLARNLLHVSHIVTDATDPHPPEAGATLIVENSQGKIWQRPTPPDYAHFSPRVRPVADSITINGLLWHTADQPFAQPTLALFDGDQPLAEVLAEQWPELTAVEQYQIGTTGVTSPVDITVVAGRGSKYSAIVIDSQTVTPEERGFIFAFIDPISGELLDSGVFDTYLSERESDQLAALIQAAPQGTIVALATFDEGLRASTPALQQAFEAIGGQIQLAQKSEEAVALIGVKGAPKGSAAELAHPDIALLDVGIGAFTSDQNIQFHSNMVKYTPNEIVLLVENNTQGLLTISEAKYPGWRATINGTETPILRSNGLFRSVIIPASESGTPHEVIFTYAPSSAVLGFRLSLGTLITCLMIVCLYVAWVNRPEQWRPPA